MPTRAEILLKRDDIIHLAELHGARNVRLFGSVSRDESTPSSDVDLLVSLDHGRSMLDRIALIQELQDLLRCKVDVVNDRALAPSMREDVLAEAVPL